MRIGPLYLSAAISPIPQPHYLNTVAIGQSSLNADALLAIAKAIEKASGRLREHQRFGPRSLDIDLLWVEGIRSIRPELVLPHAELGNRAFVLAPLADLEPGFIISPDGTTVEEGLERLLAEQQITRLEWPLEGVLFEGPA